MFIQHGSRGRQRPVAGAEDVAGEEMAGEAQALGEVLGRGRGAVPGKEGRQRQEAFAPEACAFFADGAAGFGGDEAEVFAGAGNGAGGEIEPVAEMGEEAALPANEVGDGLGLGDVGDKVQQAAKYGFLRLAFRQRAFGDGAGGGEQGEGKRGLHGKCRAGVDQFGGKAAELVGQAGDPAGFDQVAGLPYVGAGAGGAAAGQATIEAMVFGEDGGECVALAEGGGVDDDAGGLPFDAHGCSGPEFERVR